MERRHFLTGSLSFLATSLFADLANSESSLLEGLWSSGYGTSGGTYGRAVLDTNLQITSQTPTPFRLHDTITHPLRRELCLPARRSGRYFTVLKMNEPSFQIEAPPGRHYYGHGVFAADGRYLYLTENNFAEQHGAIGIYDVDDRYRRVGEFDSGGIGPHELLLDVGAQHIIVANGGILTHPASGRAKLNLDTMSPNLCRISLETQQVTQKMELVDELQNLSIRHITRAADGSVFFGLQDQFPGLDNNPLVGVWTPGSPFKFFSSPSMGWASLNGYVGSIQLDRSEKVLAATSPRGNIAVFWQRRDGKPIGVVRLPDVCGLAPTGKAGQFLLTSGRGDCLIAGTDGSGVEVINKSIAALRFDNHAKYLTNLL